MKVKKKNARYTNLIWQCELLDKCWTDATQMRAGLNVQRQGQQVTFTNGKLLAGSLLLLLFSN